MSHKIIAYNSYIGPRESTNYALRNFIFPKPSRLGKTTGIRILKTPYTKSYHFQHFDKKIPLLFVSFEATQMAFILKYGEFCDTFHSFMQTTSSSSLSSFIQTGQEYIEGAPNFEIAHDNFIDWLTHLQQILNFDWKTILPISYDIRHSKRWIAQLKQRDMALPVWMLHWCELGKVFSKKYTTTTKISLPRAGELCNVSINNYYSMEHPSSMSDALICLELAKHVRIIATDLYKISTEYGVRCF